MREYDKCGKYLIQHRGNSILRMGRVNDIARLGMLGSV